MSNPWVIIIFLLSCQISIYGQVNSVGLIKNEISDEGYILFNPLNHKVTYLINREGQKVHSWESTFVPGMSAYLALDGSLFRAGRVTDETYLNSGGAGGIIEQLDWGGQVLWNFRYSSPIVRQHHDFQLLPNGNIILLAWEKKSKEEAVTAGRDPEAIGTNQLWFEHLIEIKPSGKSGGEIIWQWNVWDHLIQDFDSSKINYGIVSDHPELVNLNHYQNTIADWIHANALEYNERLDQIMISSRGFNELWIIDHSTTTAEAKSGTGGNAGKGGDLLWRWGNPRAYNQGNLNDQQLFGQHGIDWIESEEPEQSEVFIFNNGNGRKPAIYSTIEKVHIHYNPSGFYPKNGRNLFLPEFSSTFQPDDPISIYAPLFSNVCVLPDDRMLVCVGPRGTFIEFDRDGNEVWKYINPVTETGNILKQGESIGDHQSSINSVFSIQYYPADFEGFRHRDLSPKGLIEGNVVTSIVDISGGFQMYPNPVSNQLYLEGATPLKSVKLIDLTGKIVYQQCHSGSVIIVDHLASGLYLCTINDSYTSKIMITR